MFSTKKRVQMASVVWALAPGSVWYVPFGAHVMQVKVLVSAWNWQGGDVGLVYLGKCCVLIAISAGSSLETQPVRGKSICCVSGKGTPYWMA